jgi:hypothetical protein
MPSNCSIFHRMPGASIYLINEVSKAIQSYIRSYDSSPLTPVSLFVCPAMGRVNANVAPNPSGLFSAHILPPCASVIFFDMKSPSPVPFSDLLANFSNSFGKISRSIPLPESLTLTITSLSNCSVVTAILPSLLI